MTQSMDRPEAVIITMSRETIKEWGSLNVVKRYFRRWFTGNNETVITTFWWRCGKNLPKVEVPFLYLIAENQIIFRFHVVEYHRTGEEGVMLYKYGDPERGELMKGCFIVIAGPIMEPNEPIPYKGFQGFRYSQKLF